MYFASNHLFGFFFQFHPFTIDFYVRFSSHSFNYSVSGLKLFIKLFFFNFTPLHLVFIWDLVLILLIVMYWIFNHLLNWFVFEFYPLTFYFYIKNGYHSFYCYFQLFLSFSRLNFFFNFIPYDLILIFFFKFGSFFLNHFFFNLFFQVYL